MEVVKKLFNILPFFILGVYLFSIIFLSYTDFYRINFLTFDKIDDILVFLLCFDFFYYHNEKSIIYIRSCCTIFTIIALNLLANKMQIETYFTTYALIILIWLITILQAKNDKRIYTNNKQNS